MERRIRYAHAPDGTRIAYWTLGSGEPLVYLAGGPWSHFELWDVPDCRAWYEQLAQGRTLVRYDVRGTGLSEREVSDFSLDACVGDIEAVVGDLGLDRFDLIAAVDAGPVAIAYAVRHPERVSRAVMWCAWAHGAAFEYSPRIQAWRGLIDQDWELMTETCAHIALGWDAGEIGRRAAAAMRANITRDTAQAMLEAMVAFDVTPLLAEYQTPTLVLHRDNISWLPLDIPNQFAAAIPNSRLRIITGESSAPYLGDTAPIISAIGEFLDIPAWQSVTPAAPSLQETVSGTSTSPRALPTGLSPGQRTAGFVEILPLSVSDGSISRHHPEGESSWQVEFEPAKHPGDVVRDALAEVKRPLIAVHSTSWRVQGECLVLTYAAILQDPVESIAGFEAALVEPRELARGTAVEAPAAIQVDEVVEHALRHLAWLVRDDEPIREALGADWQTALAPYRPEPFSAFDASGTLSEDDGCLLCTRFARPLAEFVESQPGG